MNEWKEVKFEDYIKFSNEKIEADKVSLDRYVSTENLLPDLGGVELAKKLPNQTKFNYFEKKDVLFSNIRTYFKKVWQAKFDGGCSNDVLVFRTNEKEILDQEFLYYIISNETFINYTSVTAKGTKMPRGDKEAIKKYCFLLPPIEEQHEIAKTLSLLDSKITLLRQQNQTLEELAQTLFKRWFVDFEFPYDAQGKPNENGEGYKSSGGKMVSSELGEIPEGWKVKQLQELISVKRGGSPRPIKNYIVEKGYPWVKISDATATESPYLMKTKEFIKEEGLKKTVYLNKGSLILSNSATPGVPKFLEIDACIHDGWLYFPKVSVITQNYMYLLFLHLKKIIVQQGSGSVFTNLKTDILKEQILPIAPSSIIKSFDNIIDSYFLKIKNNAIEIQSLTQLRDTLLPKLMNGELKIKVKE